MSSMVPVLIVGIRIDPLLGTSAVLLGEHGNLTRVLPIMIGAVEAQAIAVSLADDAPPRPGTHDLAVALIVAGGMRLDEVVVTELRDGVFFAEVFVESSAGMVSVSARPSDAIALAVRVGTPIFVNAAVLNDASVSIDHTSSDPLSDGEIDVIVDEFQRFLETATTSDFEVSPEGHEEKPAPDDDIGDGSSG
jgi:bifunctional DNase/RNase